VTAAGASEILPLSSSTFPISTSDVLASAPPSPFSRPSVSLDHVYTSRDTDLIWSIGYMPK